MALKRIYFVFAAVFVLCSSTVAAKPGGNGGGAAAQGVSPHIDAVHVDYATGRFVIEGSDLYGVGPTVTLGGVTLTLDPTITSDDSTLYASFPASPSTVDDTGSYELVVTTDGAPSNNAWVSVLIPLGYYSPAPGGGSCPCEGTWSWYFTTPSSSLGVQDLIPYCWYEDAGSYTPTDGVARGPYIDVEYYDSVYYGAYTIFYAGWDTDTGYCSDSSAVLTHEQYEACYDYLKLNAPGTDWDNPPDQTLCWY